MAVYLTLDEEKALAKKLNGRRLDDREKKRLDRLGRVLAKKHLPKAS